MNDKTLIKITAALVKYEQDLEKALSLALALRERGEDIDTAIRKAADTYLVTVEDIQKLAGSKFDEGMLKFIGGFVGIVLAIIISSYIF